MCSICHWFCMVNMQNFKNFFFVKKPIETHHGKNNHKKHGPVHCFWSEKHGPVECFWSEEWAEQLNSFWIAKASSTEQWTVFGFNSWGEQYAAFFWIKKKLSSEDFVEWKVELSGDCFWTEKKCWVVVFGKNKSKNGYGKTLFAKNKKGMRWRGFAKQNKTKQKQ